jgi:hypothetical protein
MFTVVPPYGAHLAVYRLFSAKSGSIMGLRQSVMAVTAGALLTAAPVLAQQSPAFPPQASPVEGQPPRLGAPPPGEPVVADHHVSSADLGYQSGIGPAVGQTVTWHGMLYRVVQVVAQDGRPTFSGGSRHVITTEGGTLDIGLKALDDTLQAAL